MSEKQNQYGLVNNPPAEKKPLPVTMAEKVQHKGYQKLTIDDISYDLVDRTVVEDMGKQIIQLTKDLKRAETKITKLTSTLASTIRDQEQTEKRLNKITK